MPSGFSATGRQDIAYNYDPSDRFAPELHPDPVLGSTIEPPQTGFWGITMRDKQVNAQLTEEGNFATWIANTLLDPLQKGEQHYVSLGASQRMHEASGDKLSGWDFLSHKLSPIQNVQGIRRELEFPDLVWNGEAETLKWLQQPENAVARALVLKNTGTDVFPLLGASRNREHFEYTIRRSLKHAEALNAMTRFDDENGWGIRWTSSLTSGAFNYMLTDPTFAPSLVVPFGGVQAAGARAGVVTGLRIKRMGEIGARAAQRFVLHAPNKVPAVRGFAATRTIAKGVIKLGDSPAAMHRGMASLISHRGAVATEMAMLGGLGSHAFQSERMENSSILTDLEAYQDHYRWDEVGLGVGIGAAAGFVFGGRASHRVGRLLEAQSDIAGGTAASPIRYSLDNIAGQGAADYAAVRGKRAAQRLLDENYDSVAVYFDDAVLTDVGLDRGHMARVLEELADVADGPLPANAVHRVLADEIATAAKARKVTPTVLGSQFEQEGWANALARAAKENPRAADGKMFARARELAAEETALVVQRMKDRAARAAKRRGKRPGTKTKVEFWRREAADLIETARRRSLLRHEMEYLARVDGALQNAGDESLIAKLTVAKSKAAPTVAKQVAETTGSKLTRTLKQIRRETDLIDELGKRGVKGKAAERVNAMRRLRSARKRLGKLAGEQDEVLDPQTVQKNIRAAIDRAKLVDGTDPAARNRALDDIFDSLDAHAGTLMEDQHELSKWLKSVGFGGLVRRLARAGTGMEQSWRSATAAIRFITQEIDHAKLAIDDLDPTKTGTHRSLQHLLEQTHGRISEFVDLMRKFDNAGEFGNWMRNPRSYNRKLLAFNKEAIRHITGTAPSERPAVLEAAALWAKHADEIKKLGLDSGVLSEAQALERFFPRRWNSTAISKNRLGFRSALAGRFRQSWIDNLEEAHLGTLEAMGKATRMADKDGAYIGHEIIIGGEAKVVKKLKRADLEKLEVTDKEYLKAMATKGDDGFDPIETSANRTMANLTGDTSYETDTAGRLVRKKGSGRGPQSEQSRILEEGVWGDDALEEFLDWRFLENAQGYLRSTGMRIQNAARHQKRVGIRGITMTDTIDYVEARMLKLLKADATKAERDSFRAGIKNLREKVMLAEGRLPSMREHVEGLRGYLSELWISTAGALYGQGIGSTILSTEQVQSIIGRVYAVDDVVRRVGDVFKTGAHLVGDTTGIKFLQNAEMRQQMVTLGLTQRQFRLHAMDRMMGESTYNHGFQFGPVHKLLAPWQDVFKTITGANSDAHLGHRLAEGVNASARALASNMMQIGGLDFFSMWARLMHVQSSMDEMGRFFKAGEKMADMLQTPAARKALDEAEQVATDAAIAKGKSAELSRKLGTDARFTAWKGIARKAGFGSNWQIAEKWKRNGMLTPDAMASLRSSGAVLDDGKFGRTVDWETLQNHVGATADADGTFSEVFESTTGMIQETLRKRVSEQSLMQTPTSEFARTPMGKAMNSMTTWTRSFHDNNIMDSAQMPIRVGSALMLTYLFGETVNTFMRELWTGKDPDELFADFKEDPDNYFARALTSLPWLGQFGGWLRPAADALTKDERMSRIDLGESAGEGAATAMTDVLFDTVHAATSDQDVSHRTWRTASRFLPGYRTWWGYVANEANEAITGVDLIGLQKRDSRRARDTSEVREGGSFPSITTTKPDVPDDLGFLYD